MRCLQLHPSSLPLALGFRCFVCSSFWCAAKTQYRKFETNIPRKGILRPQSQFPHSCVCERFIYYHDWSAYSSAGTYVDWSWVYIKNGSQTHECGNWDWGPAIPFLGTKMLFSLQCANCKDWLPAINKF